MSTVERIHREIWQIVDESGLSPGQALASAVADCIQRTRGALAELPVGWSMVSDPDTQMGVDAWIDRLSHALIDYRTLSSDMESDVVCVETEPALWSVRLSGPNHVFLEYQVLVRADDRAMCVVVRVQVDSPNIRRRSIATMTGFTLMIIGALLLLVLPLILLGLIFLGVGLVVVVLGYVLTGGMGRHSALADAEPVLGPMVAFHARLAKVLDGTLHVFREQRSGVLYR